MGNVSLYYLIWQLLYDGGRIMYLMQVLMVMMMVVAMILVVIMMFFLQ